MEANNSIHAEFYNFEGLSYIISFGIFQQSNICGESGTCQVLHYMLRILNVNMWQDSSGS